MARPNKFGCHENWFVPGGRADFIFQRVIPKRHRNPFLISLSEYIQILLEPSEIIFMIFGVKIELVVLG